MKRVCLQYLVPLMLLGLPMSAQANTITLDPPHFLSTNAVGASANSTHKSESPTGFTDVSTTATSNDPFGAAASAALKISGSPFPSVHASAAAFDSDPFHPENASAGASGWIDYEFSIVGAAGSVPIAIGYEGGVTALGLGGTQATSLFKVDGSNYHEAWEADLGPNNDLIHIVNGAQESLSGSSFQSTSNISAIANAVYKVTLYASVGAVQGSATAFVDPLIHIDPAFASNYSIQLSPGIGNTIAATPLPASLLMSATGLLGLATLAYRTRGKRATLSVG